MGESFTKKHRNKVEKNQALLMDQTAIIPVNNSLGIEQTQCRLSLGRSTVTRNMCVFQDIHGTDSNIIVGRK